MILGAKCAYSRFKSRSVYIFMSIQNSQGEIHYFRLRGRALPNTAPVLEITVINNKM
jgi:hypothetical protein